MSTKLCPKCGSGKIKNDSMAIIEHPDEDVSCLSCGWSGQKQELMAALPVKPAAGIDPNFTVAEEVAKTYLSEIAKSCGQPLGIAMVLSGLVGTKDKMGLSRLIRAACLGAHRATLDEIEKMQKELHNGSGN